MPFLSLNQQRQSTAGTDNWITDICKSFVHSSNQITSADTSTLWFYRLVTISATTSVKVPEGSERKIKVC